MSHGRLFFLVVFAALGCGPPPLGVAPAAADAPKATAAAPAVPIVPGTAAEPAGSNETVAPPVPSAVAVAPSAAPAASLPASGSPTAPPGSVPPTSEDKKVIAMCEGKARLYTQKEEQLLKQLDAAGRQDLSEQAATIRERRMQQLLTACARLRAEGKL
jgi:hypothetical protein